jgi:hypothetical protein
VLSRAGYAGLNIETTQPITSFLLTPSYLTMLCMCNFASRSLLLVRGCGRHGQESVNIAGFLPHGTSPRLVLPVRDMSKHRRPHAALIPMHTHTTPNARAPPAPFPPLHAPSQRLAWSTEKKTWSCALQLKWLMTRGDGSDGEPETQVAQLPSPQSDLSSRTSSFLKPGQQYCINDLERPTEYDVSTRGLRFIQWWWYYSVHGLHDILPLKASRCVPSPRFAFGRIE